MSCNPTDVIRIGVFISHWDNRYSRSRKLINDLLAVSGLRQLNEFAARVFEQLILKEMVLDAVRKFLHILAELSNTLNGEDLFKQPRSEFHPIWVKNAPESCC
jgi:hypothetical protein